MYNILVVKKGDIAAYPATFQGIHIGFVEGIPI